MYRSLLASTHNTRELGGLITADGVVTREGRIWRSDAPDQWNDADSRTLMEYQMTTIIDMRTEEETRRKPNPLSGRAGFFYYHCPITEGSTAPRRLEEVPLSYMRIARAENISRVFRTMAEAERGVLFHCTAGKDRTGVVSAILLTACGVDRQSIVRDYAVSREYNRQRLEAFLTAHPEIDRQVVLANEKSMEAFLDAFEKCFGRVENYFAEIGLTREHLDSIRRKLLD